MHQCSKPTVIAASLPSREIFRYLWPIAAHDGMSRVRLGKEVRLQKIMRGASLKQTAVISSDSINSVRVAHARYRMPPAQLPGRYTRCNGALAAPRTLRRHAAKSKSHTPTSILSFSACEAGSHYQSAARQPSLWEPRRYMCKYDCDE